MRPAHPVTGLNRLVKEGIVEFATLTNPLHMGSQAVLGLGGGLDYFLQTVFNDPTFAECYLLRSLP